MGARLFHYCHVLHNILLGLSSVVYYTYLYTTCCYIYIYMYNIAIYEWRVIATIQISWHSMAMNVNRANKLRRQKYTITTSYNLMMMPIIFKYIADYQYYHYEVVVTKPFCLLILLPLFTFWYNSYYFRPLAKHLWSIAQHL